MHCHSNNNNNNNNNNTHLLPASSSAPRSASSAAALSAAKAGGGDLATLEAVLAEKDGQIKDLQATNRYLMRQVCLFV